MRAPAAQRQRPSQRGRITDEQVRWIEARDGIGRLLDRRLRAHPAPRERLALALVEESLRQGDRAVGL